MATQVISLPTSGDFSGYRGWNFTSNRTQIDSSLTASNVDRYLGAFGVNSNGRLLLRISSGASGTGRGDLTTDFEADGYVTIEVGSTSYTFALAGEDNSSDYLWYPDNDSDADDLYDALATDQSATLTLYVPLAVTGAVGGTFPTDIDAELYVGVPETIALTGAPGGTFTATLEAELSVSVPETVSLTGSPGGTFTTDIDAELYVAEPPETTALTSNTGGTFTTNIDAELYVGQLSGTINLPRSGKYGSDRGWSVSSNRPQIESDFVSSGTTRYFAQLTINTSNQLIFVTSSASSGFNNADLSNDFESDGALTIMLGGDSYTFLLDGADTSSAYIWTPSNTDDVEDLYDALNTRQNGATLRLSLLATIDLTGSPGGTFTSDIGAELYVAEAADPINLTGSPGGTFPTSITAALFTGVAETIDLTGASGGTFTADVDASLLVLEELSTTIDLPTSMRFSGTRGWVIGTNRPQIDSSFTPPDTDRYFSLFTVSPDGELVLTTSSASSGYNNADLSDDFEADGWVAITLGDDVYEFELDGADSYSPYIWTPSNDDDAIDLYNALATDQSGATLRLSIVPVVDLTGTPGGTFTSSVTAELDVNTPEVVALTGSPGGTFTADVDADLMVRTPSSVELTGSTGGTFTASLTSDLMVYTPVAIALTGAPGGTFTASVGAELDVDAPQLSALFGSGGGTFAPKLAAYLQVGDVVPVGPLTNLEAGSYSLEVWVYGPSTVSVQLGTEVEGTKTFSSAETLSGEWSRLIHSFTVTEGDAWSFGVRVTPGSMYGGDGIYVGGWRLESGSISDYGDRMYPGANPSIVPLNRLSGAPGGAFSATLTAELAVT